MTSRHNRVVILVSLAISGIIWLGALNRHHPAKTETLSARIFRGSAGWGYDILLNDTLFIHQECIPVIATKKGFPEKEQAQKAADLVLQKIKQNKLPTLSKVDIEHICSPEN